MAMMSARDLNNIEDMYAMHISKDGKVDKVDHINSDKMTRMIQDVYGKGFETNIQARNMLKYVGHDSGTFDLGKFRIFIKTHQTLLTPTLMFQQRLRHNVGGEWFWNRHTITRKGIPDSNFILTINSLRAAQKKYPKEVLTGVSALPSIKSTGFNEKNKDRIRRNNRRERYNHYFAGLYSAGSALHEAGHVAYKRGSVMIRIMRRLGRIMVHNGKKFSLKYRASIAKATQVFKTSLSSYRSGKDDDAVGSAKEVQLRPISLKPIRVVARDQDQSSQNPFGRNIPSLSDFSKKSSQFYDSDNLSNKELLYSRPSVSKIELSSLNSFKKTEMSPRNITFGKEKESFKNSSRSVNMSAASSFKKSLTLPQNSFKSKPSTLSDRSMRRGTFVYFTFYHFGII